MIGLVRLLKIFSGAIEADFAEIFHIDLWRSLRRGEISFARVDRLLAHLGDDSRFMRAVISAMPIEAPAPEDSAPDPVDLRLWSRTERLLASVTDELTIANWQRAGGGSKKPVLLTAPPKAPPPNVARALARRGLDPARIREYLDRIGPQAEPDAQAEPGAPEAPPPASPKDLATS